MTRFGMGYDVHRLVEGRKLILGGVEIPWEKGLLGHSDADVLLHAVADALLGAAALGDIGRHFPDTDEKFAGADSMKLLRSFGSLAKMVTASETWTRQSWRRRRSLRLILKKWRKILPASSAWSATA